MHYFIFGYAETPFVESLTIRSTTPGFLIGDSEPIEDGTAPATAGNTFYNNIDTVNKNIYDYAPTKTVVIVNTHVSDSATVKFKTVDSTINGFENVVEDFDVVVPSGKTAYVSRLPAIFNDSGKVKVEGTGTGIADTYVAILNLI